jgi:phage FluMu protein Com
MREDLRDGYRNLVNGVAQEHSRDVECPHCHKTFAAEPIEGGRAARYLGFKCPHCRLFVPLERAADAELSRDPDGS